MRKVHSLIAGIAGIAGIVGLYASGCTQVHQLGQVDSTQTANSADSATSSMPSEDTQASGTGDTQASDSNDTESTDTSDEDTSPSTDTSDETSQTGESDESGESGESGETGETGGPSPEPCEIADLGGNRGLSVEIVFMSEWNDGACHEVHVTNETPDDVIWYRELRFGGTLDNAWNTDIEQLSPTDWRFEGQATADNVALLSGDDLLFGVCMVCMP